MSKPELQGSAAPQPEVGVPAHQKSAPGQASKFYDGVAVTRGASSSLDSVRETSMTMNDFERRFGHDLMISHSTTTTTTARSTTACKTTTSVHGSCQRPGTPIPSIETHTTITKKYIMNRPGTPIPAAVEGLQRPTTGMNLLSPLRFAKDGTRTYQRAPVSRSHDSLSYPVNRDNSKRRALLIGINYTGQNGALSDCLDHVDSVKGLLIDTYKWQETDMRVLTRAPSSKANPTRREILAGIQWLVSGATTGDSLFLYYYGHGGRTRDFNGGEDDGMDEAIFPADYQSSGPIVDDDLFTLLCQSLPKGARLTALFDSIHSGSILDLPYTYCSTVKESSQLPDSARVLNETKAEILQFSSCRDNQTSSDVTSSHGAISKALISCLQQNANPPIGALMENVRGVLAKKYSQAPQLFSGQEVGDSERFRI
ncbi:MAG: hypothetical protein SGCHY_002732 [Lobulomycetales sp.]